MKRTALDKSYLSPSDVAEIMMVTPATIRLWASKGELNAVSTPGGHRRFQLQDIEEFAHARNLTLNLPEDPGTRVLIVDDDAPVATYLTRVLRRAGPQVEYKVARNGFEAGKLVHSFSPHIVLLDLMMPELNGFDVCNQIKSDQQTSQIRVIAMTGFYNNENVRRAIEAGAECCIEKPFDHVQLLDLLGLERRESAYQP